MDDEVFDDLLSTIRERGLTEDQRKALGDALKKPRGRPRKGEKTIGDLLDKYSAVIAMRQLQRHASVTYDEAAELTADEYGVKAETLKSWIKRYSLREMADRNIDIFDDPKRRIFEARQRNRDVVEEANKMGIAYGPDWPISRLKAKIMEVKGKK